MSEIRRLQVSINLTRLGEAVRNQHPAVTTAKSGDKYAAVTVWINEQPDNYGNDASLQLTQQKDATDKATYIGNGKTDKQLRAMAEAKQAQVNANMPVDDPGINDLFF